jgi:hypothetical protein
MAAALYFLNRLCACYICVICPLYLVGMRTNKNDGASLIYNVTVLRNKKSKNEV